MSANYTGSPTSTQAPGPTPAPGAVPIISLPADTDGSSTANWYQAHKESADFIAWLMARAGTQSYGNGGDGSVTLDGSVAAPAWATKSGAVYTMARSAYCTNLTVTGAGTVLKMAGYRVYCTGTLTTAAGGVISNDGSSASGISGAAAAPVGELGGAGAGAGGAGANTAGQPGNAGGAVAADSLGGNGGAGGDNVGHAQAGGAGGTATQLAANKGTSHASTSQTSGYVVGLAGGSTPVWTAIRGGAGGGGGAATSGTATFGGGGGGGGGLAAIHARTISCANATDIHVNGGNGATADANAGGGGGGGGGWLFITYVSSNVAFSAANNATGGLGGSGSFSGANGANGIVEAIATS